MREKIRKFPKWVKLASSILGFIAVLFIILYASASVWMSTWKTYRNEEFGFNFKYPTTWYISGNPIDKQYFDSDRGIFWIDSKEELPPNEQDIFRSPGNLEVHVLKKPTTHIEEQIEQRFYSTYTTTKFGERPGYVYDIASITSDRVQLFTKDAFVETDDYVYVIGTQTYSESTSFLSKIKARYYHWIGSTILDSFKFD